MAGELELDFKPTLFDPHDEKRPPGPQVREEAQTNGEVYRYKREIILAVNVALAAKRPLLVAGPPGCGKSTLARHIAKVKGWKYGETVVTSRTQANDLLWTFDSLQRLRDAQLKSKDSLLPAHAYLEPGVLWWALSPHSARLRGQARLDKKVKPATDPLNGRANEVEPGVVVLIDEIDKADPDVPNDLLGPLGTGAFRVRDNNLDLEVTKEGQRTVLVVLTTNRERELSQAFLRRCIYLELAPPSVSDLLEIAFEHFGTRTELHRSIAEAVVQARQRADEAGARGPSTAEFLDAVTACSKLSVQPDSSAWKRLELQVLAKYLPQPDPQPADARSLHSRDPELERLGF